jgi:hypothetical protein
MTKLLDTVNWRCTKCGKPPGCKCWDKTVTLECKKCKKKKRVESDPTDPKGTARVLMLCPDCNPGDFDVLYYFDAAGKEITQK